MADGLPAWPENNDLAGIADADLAAMEQAYLAEFHRLAADPAADIAAIRTYSAHVQALRAEAANRFAAAANTEPDTGDTNGQH